MRVLVLGGYGLVGSCLMPVLVRDGYEVLAPARSDLELRGGNELKQYLRKVGQIDVLINLAAVVGGIQFNKCRNGEIFISNSLIYSSIINAKEFLKEVTILNFGSTCMYPKSLRTLSERDLFTGDIEITNFGYAFAKLAGMRLLELEFNGVSHVTSLIPSNLYGPGDCFDSERAHLIPAIILKISKALEFGGPVQIWGDGSARREFLYVSDLVEFVRILLRKAGMGHELPIRVNVGFGQDYSVLEYYETVAEVMGYHDGFKFDVTRPVGVFQKLVCSDGALRLGWEPKIGLHEGIARTVSYFRAKQ